MAKQVDINHLTVYCLSENPCSLSPGTMPSWDKMRTIERPILRSHRLFVLALLGMVRSSK